MSTFKVGDKVKIVKKFNPGDRSIEWTTGMNPTLGLEGEVLDVYDNRGSIQYLVRSRDDEWWYLKESLELINSEDLNTGDIVKIVKKFKSPKIGRTSAWESHMDSTIGQKGVLEKVLQGDYNDPAYLIRLSNGDGWWYYRESLELAKDVPADLPKFTNREAFDNLQLKKGDTIKICGKAKSNSRGWINSWIKAMDVHVGHTFTLESTPKYSDSGLHIPVTTVRWPFFVLEKVTAEQKQPVTKTASKSTKDLTLKKGSRVKIILNKSCGHPEGTIGTIVAIGTKSYIVNADNVSYSHMASELVLVPDVAEKSSRFKTGDKVRVVKNTSAGFKVGTIGTVSRVVKRQAPGESDVVYEYDIICPPQSFPYIHPESDLELHSEMCPKPEKKDKYITSSDYERISVKSVKGTGSKMVVDVEVLPKTSVQSIVVTSTIVDTTSHLSPYLLLG